MKKPKIIFELQNVNVEFEKHSLANKSLRSALGEILLGETRPKINALNNVSLTIREGERVGIIGRNGAGKSTLLRVFSKVIIPNSGRAVRDDNMHIVPLLELGIGFQADLSGREICLLTGIIMGYSKKEMDKKIDSIFEFAELEDFIDEPVKNYSSGMYARLAFAIATDINPEVLIVDEVFGVGDEFFMRKCTQRMHELMSKGITTIFVSHNLELLISECDRLIWLEKGKMIMDGESSQVAAAYRKIELAA